MARKKPTMSVEDLVRERTSPAVKLALRTLVEATAATDAGKKPRKGKAQCLKPSI